jgi:hypothetical protein
VKFALHCPGDRVPANDSVLRRVAVGLPDMGVTVMQSPEDTVATGSITPLVRVHSYGSDTSSARLFFLIPELPYAESLDLFLPGRTDTGFCFPVCVLPRGVYSVRCSVAMAGDSVPQNNCLARRVWALVPDFGVVAILSPRPWLNPDTLHPSARIGNLSPRAAKRQGS